MKSKQYIIWAGVLVAIVSIYGLGQVFQSISVTNVGQAAVAAPAASWNIGASVKTTKSAQVKSQITGKSSSGTQPSGSIGTILNRPVQAKGAWWWNVDYQTGFDGWTEQSNLVLNAAPPPPTDSGTKTYKTIVVLVKDYKATAEPVTVAEAKNLVFNSKFQAFMKEQSYGKVAFAGDAAGWYSLENALPSDACDFMRVVDLNHVASTLGISFANYEKTVFLLNGVAGGCATLNTAIVGLRDFNPAYPDDFFYFHYLLAHEIGHDIGNLKHANGWDCGSEIFSGTCTIVEQGNPFDVLGSGRLALHHNAYFKERLGWLPSSRILSITQNGSYTINTLESTTGIAGAKIKVGTAAPYYLEFRQPVGFDAAINPENSNGLIVNNIVTVGNATFPSLLVLNKSLLGYHERINNAALKIGQSFTDPKTGITIGPVTAVTSSSITFNVSFTPIACIRAAPTIVDGTITAGIHVGVPSNFIIVLKNNDNSGCPQSTFKLRPLLPTGWSGRITLNGVAVDQVILPFSQEARLNLEVIPSRREINYIGIEAVNIDSGMSTTFTKAVSAL